MKLRIATWVLMFFIGALLYFDVLNFCPKIAALFVQSILIIANTYQLFKSDNPRKFESDDILDC